jgi:hypothetical protein
MRTPRSGRSQLTPQGWHKLHAVHCGNFASSARRSARGDNPDDANKQPRVSFTTTQIQTGLVPVTQETEMRATLPRNVFQRRRFEATRGVDRAAQEAILDENDEVLGLAQQHDIFSLIRAVPEGGVVNVATRYVRQEGGANAKGLFDYGRSLAQSLVKTKVVCESGTQVEHEYLGAHESAMNGEGEGQLVRLKSLPGGWRRENVEQTVEEMVLQRARKDLRGRSTQAAGGVWGLRSGSVDSVDDTQRPHGAQRPLSMDRTYRSHLLRTREAHQRYNKVALVLQMAYRCHMARLVAVNLQRNPRHLKAMLAKQIHAFAALLQSNMRCMLAKRRVAKQASRRIMSAQDRWRARRNRASLFIQSWFCQVVQSRLLAQRYTSAPNAACCLQRSFRCYRARSYHHLPARLSLSLPAPLCVKCTHSLCSPVSCCFVCDCAGLCLKTEGLCVVLECRRTGEHMRADNVHRILHECQQMESSCVSTIQRAFRCSRARRSFNQEKSQYEALRLQPGTSCLWRGAQDTLTGPQLEIALKQQAWAVVKLQQSLLSCLLHREWLDAADDFMRRTRHQEAVRIQSAWRHKSACRTAIASIRHHDLERRHHQVQLAASLLQRAMLGKWARQRLGYLGRKALTKVVTAAAIDVQRVWYGHAARNWVRNKIHLAELQRHNQHRHQVLALRLQLSMRCFWARREMTDRYWTAKSHQASIDIQCAARVFLARNEFQVHVLEEVQRRKTSAVLHLQAFTFSNTVSRNGPRIRSLQVPPSLPPSSPHSLCFSRWRLDQNTG